MFITLLFISFVSMLQYSIGALHGAEVPTTTPGTQLVPRQLLAGCGLNLNVWGQISPTKASGNANLCLQCRVNVLGFSVGFSFYDALSSSIGSHGVSASDCAILQSYIDDDLLKISAKSKTTESCTTACSRDKRCASCSFEGGRCRFNAVNYRVQNHAAVPLAQAFQGIFSQGGSRYCSICPNDRSCGPTATGIPRRSSAFRKRSTSCPIGLTACPISPTLNFTHSTPFECLDTTEEMTSCGGCATLGKGINCSTLKGVASSGCSDGKCKIFSCISGYQLSKAVNICYKSQHNKFKKTSH